VKLYVESGGGSCSTGISGTGRGFSGREAFFLRGMSLGRLLRWSGLSSIDCRLAGSSSTAEGIAIDVPFLRGDSR